MVACCLAQLFWTNHLRKKKKRDSIAWFRKNEQYSWFSPQFLGRLGFHGKNESISLGGESWRSDRSKKDCTARPRSGRKHRRKNRKSATESAQPQTSKNEEIIGNDDRIQNKIYTTAEMIEAIVSDSMTDTCDDRPAHHMMTNEDRAQRRVCQDHFFGASNDNHEDAVHPKRDMHAEKTAEILNENDTVRPKCDLIVMKVNVTANEEFELRHKCDEDAAKSVVDENTNVAAASRQEKNANGKAAVKTYQQKMMKSQVKMEQLQDLWMKGEILQEERSKIWKRCVNRYQKCIRDKNGPKYKKRYTVSLKSSEASRNISCIESAKKRMPIPKVTNEKRWHNYIEKRNCNCLRRILR